MDHFEARRLAAAIQSLPGYVVDAVTPRTPQESVVGYDSADGTCLKRNPPYYLEMIGAWLDSLRRQPALGLEVH